MQEWFRQWELQQSLRLLLALRLLAVRRRVRLLILEMREAPLRRLERRLR
jgi:hypothetical protein